MHHSFAFLSVLIYNKAYERQIWRKHAVRARLRVRSAICERGIEVLIWEACLILTIQSGGLWENS